MLNRCVVTVKTKQPFLDWLKSLPDPADETLDGVTDVPAPVCCNRRDTMLLCVKWGRMCSRKLFRAYLVYP